jgi:hypothetical protein
VPERHRIEPWVYVRDLLLRLNADDPRLEEMLPDRWAAAHPEAKTVADWIRDLTGIDITRCPHCGAPLEREELSPLRLPFHSPPPSLSYWDTS